MAKQKQGRPLWAKITDAASAEEAVKGASNAAWLVAGVTAVVSGIALVNGTFLGFDGWGLVDAAVMAIAAWRLRHHSRLWAIVALADWVLGLYTKVVNWNPAMTGAILVSLALLLAFIGGVRGTFALARFRRNLLPAGATA